ncbi:MAG: hypothetical protein RL748_576 [Pseudomonadota bacterium]|jgi:hypothetical protein
MEGHCQKIPADPRPYALHRLTTQKIPYADTYNNSRVKACTHTYPDINLQRGIMRL